MSQPECGGPAEPERNQGHDEIMRSSVTAKPKSSKELEVPVLVLHLTAPAAPAPYSKHPLPASQTTLVTASTLDTITEYSSYLFPQYVDGHRKRPTAPLPLPFSNA